MKNPFDEFADAVKGFMSVIGEYTDMFAVAARLVHEWRRLSHTERVQFNEQYPTICREILLLEDINDNT